MCGHVGPQIYDNLWLLFYFLNLRPLLIGVSFTGCTAAATGLAVSGPSELRLKASQIRCKLASTSASWQ